MKKTTVSALLVSLTLFGTTFAWDPYPGFYLGDSRRAVSNGFEVGVTLTKPFDNVRWAAVGNIGVIASSKLLFTYGLNMVYNLRPYSRVIPYVLAGIGGDIGENNFYLGANVGAGIKFFIAPDWMYSLQTRYIWYGDRGSDWLIAGILDIPVGDSKKVLDIDGDGVPNYLDESPDTPRGAKVDVKGNFLGMNLNINFATDSDVVADSYYGDLRDFAEYLRNHRDQKIEIQGHTDDMLAKPDVNLDLSFRRATSVAKILTGTFNVPADQLSVNGYGSTRPLVANDSDENRSMNRRIEAVLMK